MTLGKAGAICVIGGVLAVQLFALSPAGRGGWYWPFVDYPMYSAAKEPGATFGLFDLEIVGCDGERRALAAQDLRLPPFRYRNAVEVAAGGRPDRPREPEEIPASRRLLDRVIIGMVPGDWCTAEVYGRIFEMGEHGLVTPDVPRRQLAAWRISREGAE